MEPLVTLTDATKSFGGTSVLSGVNLMVNPGELIVVLGGNGAGKTTLLRLMAGLLGLNQGELLIQGLPLRRFSAEQRSSVFFLPDFPPFFEELTVLENLETWINLYEQVDQNREKEAFALLDRFQIAEFANLYPAALSRGQRFKLALTCYEAVKAPLGLFDEPFASGLDALGLRTMRGLIREAVRQGRSVIYTTQLVKYALEFAQRVLVIDRSQIYFDGSPEKFQGQLEGGDVVLQRFAEGEAE